MANFILFLLIQVFFVSQKDDSLIGFYECQIQNDAHHLESISIKLDSNQVYSYEEINEKCSTGYFNKGKWILKKDKLFLKSSKSYCLKYSLSAKGEIIFSEEELEVNPCHRSREFSLLELHLFPRQLCEKTDNRNSCYTKLNP